MKRFFLGCFSLIQAFVFFLPFYYLRLLWCKIFFKRFGKNNYISRNVDIRAPWKGEIGNNVVINKRVVLDMRGGGYIGNNVDIAQDVQIWSAEHNVKSPNHEFISDPIRIEDNVWIASRVTILPGVTIKEGAVVATGAIVTKDVPPYTVVGGIPARKIGERNKKLNYTLKHKPFFE